MPPEQRLLKQQKIEVLFLVRALLRPGYERTSAGVCQRFICNCLQDVATTRTGLMRAALDLGDYIKEQVAAGSDIETLDSWLMENVPDARPWADQQKMYQTRLNYVDWMINSYLEDLQNDAT